MFSPHCVRSQFMDPFATRWAFESACCCDFVLDSVKSFVCNRRVLLCLFFTPRSAHVASSAVAHAVESTPRCRRTRTAPESPRRIAANADASADASASARLARAPTRVRAVRARRQSTSRGWNWRQHARVARAKDHARHRVRHRGLGSRARRERRDGWRCDVGHASRGCASTFRTSER